MYKSVVRNKLSELWRDKRPFKLRLILSLLCTLACTFTFIIFGPYELYIQNMQFLTFPFDDLVWPMLLTGFCCFAVMNAALLILRGKVFNYVLSLLFACTLAGYLQGNLWNINHGSLDGAEITWLEYKWPMLWNCLVWLFTILAVFILLYFSRKFWFQAIAAICCLLVGMQAAALISLVIDTDFYDNQDLYLSRNYIYDVAPQKNVVVFLLDAFDNSFADEELELHPEWRNELGGFTYYRNCVGSYSRTTPSITYLLTGAPYDYDIPAQEYFKNAWAESTFLDDIKKNGYKTQVYTSYLHVFFETKNVVGKIDNVDMAKKQIDYKKIIKKMLLLSAYRYSPEAFKPYFRFYTDELNDIASVEAENKSGAYTINDAQFWADYRASGLSVDNKSKGAFIFYHLHGAHRPYTLNENAEYVPEGTNRDLAISGNMNMIFDYIAELKAKGLYDQTAIIITADHGWAMNTLEDYEFAPLPVLMIKPAGADTSMPLQVSDKQVSHDNLRASIIGYFGLDTTKYGRTIESIGENEPIKRIFNMQIANEAVTQQDGSTYVFEINGDANDFSNWSLIEEKPIKYPWY